MQAIKTMELVKQYKKLTAVDHLCGYLAIWAIIYSIIKKEQKDLIKYCNKRVEVYNSFIKGCS